MLAIGTGTGRRTVRGVRVLVCSCAVLFGGLVTGPWARAQKTLDVPGVRVEDFGKTEEGTPVRRYTLRNGKGSVAKIMEYGATLTEMHVPDAKGAVANVVLGFDQLKEYLGPHPAYGATMGRFANRIRHARFALDGAEVKVTVNHAGEHHIHGGKAGFHRRVWTSRLLPETDRDVAVEFSYTAADGEEGFPGRLTLQVIYRLTLTHELEIQYRATTDKPTVVNFTNHSYFNLAGTGTVLDHELQLFAGQATEVDELQIPTGRLTAVKGTPLDFTQPQEIGKRIAELYPKPGGYDHCYVIDGRAGELRRAARVREPRSGRVLECLTTEPGVQLYTANWPTTRYTGTGGVPHVKHSGFCLETQHYPDSPNHVNFPTTILRPGEVFRSTTVFRFSTESERK